MIILTSDHTVFNEGYIEKTDFIITANGYPPSSTIINIKYFWGDGTVDIFNPTTPVLYSSPITRNKVYRRNGKFTVTVIVTYKLSSRILNERRDFVITIKPIPTEIFLVNTTTRNNNSKLYARITRFSYRPNPEIFGQNLENLKYIQWDFGNGVLSNRPTINNATFNEAGVFAVRMLAYTKGNDKYEYQRIFTIQEYLNDSIRFSQVPPPTYAGHLNRFPFEIEITSPVNEPHVVDLYAQFSRSYPTLDNPTKYSFLRPEWRFLDLRRNVIKSIQTTNNRPIRVNEFGEEVTVGGFIAGYKGTARFYFVDDWFNQDQIITKQQYTTLWATLRSNNIRNNKTTDNIDGLHPGHANNTAQAWCPYVTLWRKPEVIKFTRNGVNPLPPIQFVGSDVPITFSIGYRSAVVPDIHNRQGNLQLADTLGGFARYVPHYDTDLLLDINTNSLTSPLSSFLKPKEQPYIRYKNSNNLLTGGYYKATYERPNSTTLTMSAKVVVPEPDLRANNFNPLLWLLNPVVGEVNVAQYTYTTNNIINNPQYFYTNSVTNYVELFRTNRIPVKNIVRKNPNMDKVFLYKFKTEEKTQPHISSVFDERSHLTGLHAVAALNSPTYHAWVSDVESDKIYRLTSDGKIYLNIDLRNLNYNFNTKAKLIPHTLVVDKDLNLFVGLAGSRHILKFDDTGKLRAVLNTNNIIPICIDVDVNNNLYISGIDRTQNKQSVLLKYNNNLSTQLLSKTYANTFLGNILVSPLNKIYVIRDGHLDKSLNTIYNTRAFIEELNINTFNIIKTHGPQSFIKHMVLDRFGSLYFNHSYNSVIKIEPSGRTFTANIPSDSLTDFSKTVIDGLNCNINDKIYAINSLDNKVTVLNSRLGIENFFYINPAKIEHKLGNNSQIQQPLEVIASKKPSLKANGDFTGWKWNYKFGVKNNKEDITIVSKSQTLSFRQHNQFKFFANNETFDMGKYMYDHSFMKSLKESPFLYNNKFYDADIQAEVIRSTNEELLPIQRQLNRLLVNNDFSEPELIEYLQSEVNRLTDNLKEVNLTRTNKKGFFGSIFGTFPYAPDDLGVSLFSKIANFSEKTVDPDTCDIKHLYDIIKKVDFNDESYKIKFPLGVDRIVDYASISPNKLIGVKCGCSTDIFERSEYQLDTCKFCGREVVSNRGEEIKDPNYIVQSGDYVVLKNTKSNKFRKVLSGPLNQETLYTITKLATSIGLPEEWRASYKFYKYVSKPEDLIETGKRKINSTDIIQVSTIQLNSPYFSLLETFISPLSTHTYALTSSVNFGTTDVVEWNKNTQMLSGRTIFNFSSSRSMGLSSFSYVWETSSRYNFTEFSMLRDNILTLPNYRKGNTISYTVSSIEYKSLINLEKRNRIESVIDWDQPQTTLPLGKTEAAWYNQNGIIETMINYELQKGLGLI
jgi:hypothetical protein